ncbi:hypothetical protein [Aquimarina longa]|uniref:hypothetical protein n=1 Tax=Aquimarina longa TaxID=1080221 RepID=UPI00078028AB|nr:hypothetical protein [Aquimarina longa]
MKKHVLVAFFIVLVNNSCIAQNKNPDNFLPEGYVVFQKIYGDLNKDGLEDCIIITKGTDKNNFVIDEYRGELDRNRRGIIVLFNKKDHYALASKNYSCFSSENENGGIYYPPQLSIAIEKNKLYIHYAHGRYGYWKYTFRFQNSDFELIGFDASANHGPIVNREISINFLTKKELIIENTNENTEESGDEIFKETWKELTINKLLKLSEIKDFDELDLYTY